MLVRKFLLKEIMVKTLQVLIPINNHKIHLKIKKFKNQSKQGLKKPSNKIIINYKNNKEKDFQVYLIEYDKIYFDLYIIILLFI